RRRVRQGDNLQRAGAAQSQACDRGTEESGGDRLKGYVLDLRNNSGGLLDVATGIADDFLDSGIITKSRGRTDQHAKPRLAQPGDILDGKPMIVLVNGGPASGAEIV